MDRFHFVIIGSGWRSLYYVRIAKALPELFTLDAMYCRTAEKAEKVADEWNIHTVTSIEECERLAPDFVVAAVNKASQAEVSLQWIAKGFTVLQETPAALDVLTLEKLWQAQQCGAKLVIAEQYTRYPSYAALLNVLHSDLIGERDFISLSAAHEYHGASLMRAFLDVPPEEPFTVCGASMKFPVVRTRNRYERFTDGLEKESSRGLALFRWENGKAALYDFDSEQYHSPIRNNFIKIQGRRGEIRNNEISYLDEKNEPKEASFEIISRIIHTGEKNPHFRSYPEITGIMMDGKNLYKPRFGEVGLSEDETAVSVLMEQTGIYAREKGPSPYPLREALQDGYMGLLMRQALEMGTEIKSRPQIWQ